MYTGIVFGNSNGKYNYSEFIVDFVDDLLNLPTTIVSGICGINTYSPCAFGSVAFVVENGEQYVLNSEGQWVIWSGEKLETEVCG